MGVASWRVALSDEWLLAVDLGSFAMAGGGLLFFVVWAVDRSRTSALAFAVAIAAYIAGTVALSVPTTAAFASSIHGVFFPTAMALLADGLLRRIGERLSRRTVIGYLVVMVVVVWYFAYVSPLLVGRVVTQNLVTALLFLTVAHRLRRHVLKTGRDRAALIATLLLAAALTIGVLVAPFSAIPRELVTRADLDSYMQSNLELCLIVSSTIVLPACMITLLAVTVVDMVQELRSQRDRDELTGLLNRRGFNRHAETPLASADRCALILADLDHFKAVNDTLGHAGGDRVLIAFARILTASLTGPLVGRIGGEEFAVLLPHAGVESAVDWAESVRVRMADQAGEFGSALTTVTASFGIAAVDVRAQLTDMLDAADKALYRAKAGGRNQTAVSSCSVVPPDRLDPLACPHRAEIDTRAADDARQRP